MPATPIVVLDSNEYIFGIARVDPNCEALLHRLSEVNWRDKVQVVTPRIVEREVVRNLQAIDPLAPKLFYSILANRPWTGVTYEDPAGELIGKYLDLGLAEEDAIIAAVVEWSGAGVLVSENRHFLEELETEAFEVVDAAEFLEMLQTGRIPQPVVE